MREIPLALSSTEHKEHWKLMEMTHISVKLYIYVYIVIYIYIYIPLHHIEEHGMGYQTPRVFIQELPRWLSDKNVTMFGHL